MSAPQNSLAGLLSLVLAEQMKQTAILQQIASQQTLLIEALGEDEPEDPGAPIRTYMDGSKVI